MPPIKLDVQIITERIYKHSNINMLLNTYVIILFYANNINDLQISLKLFYNLTISILSGRLDMCYRLPRETVNK